MQQSLLIWVISNLNTGGATALCLDPHDLVLSKYAARREKDLEFNRALVRYRCVNEDALLRLAATLPVDAGMKDIILRRIKANSATNSQTAPKPPKPCSTDAAFPLSRDSAAEI